MAKDVTKRYVLTGDIKHPGRVLVEAYSVEGAIAKAEAGHFEIWDEDAYDCLAFEFCGDTEDGVELHSEERD